jgi:hypothetical protein
MLWAVLVHQPAWAQALLTLLTEAVAVSVPVQLMAVLVYQVL